MQQQRSIKRCLETESNDTNATKWKNVDKQNNQQRNIEKKDKLHKSNVIINKPGQQAKTQKSKNFVKKCIEKAKKHREKGQASQKQCHH
jgi:hypothetical protein